MKATFLAVRHYPDRKKPCLVLEQGNTGIVLATFRNEECAEAYKIFLGQDREVLYRAMDDDIEELFVQGR